VEPKRPLPAEPEFLSPKASDGKDELNLAEFPLCSIAERVQPNQSSLVFEDQTWDGGRQEMITRQLTITASAQHGLPTALDDEVILGLIQLSKLQGFTDRKIYFSRYQLLRLLDWADDGQSYERLEKSLNRWVGVTLYYKNAWWNKEQQCWADEKFHILDNVTLYDRDKGRRKGAKPTPLPASNFVWNEVMFRSFRAGNLKGLDFEFYKGLKSSVAKRIYRFLDKRFFHRRHWEFDLKEFAWEHIGLARSHDIANLKRRLSGGIQELEAHGFVTPLPIQQRFKKLCSGKWRIIFDAADSTTKREPQPAVPISQGEGDSMVKALVERGISSFTASEIVSRYPFERIKSQLEIFDWYISNTDARVSRNPAGFLITSIKGEYAPPKGFLTLEQKQARERKAAERKRKAEERQKRLAAEQEAKNHAREIAVRQFWKSLSDEERVRLEQEAIEQAPMLQRRLLENEGSLADAAKKSILEAYALKLMAAGS
jgi:hypothetical protein